MRFRKLLPPLERQPGSPRVPPGGRTRLLLVVEGRHDVVFLRTLSRTLHAADAAIPDLAALEAGGELVFLPFGGGDVLAWAERLAAIGLSELHIYDRESAPETELRRRAASLVNQRSNCRAFVMRKHSLENYLHPGCIREISGLEVSYGDQDDVAELVARGCYERSGKPPAWEALPGRARKRFRERAKKWLNRLAVELMTPELLAASDPAGEIHTWLQTADDLLKHAG
jgi:putative ATP-dependent endonuclease of OLD family